MEGDTLKKISWLKYFIYITLILITAFIEQNVLINIKNTTLITFKTHPYFENIIIIIFNVVIGVLLGIDHLFYQVKQTGSWTFNLPKAIIMGLPSLYFSFGIFILTLNSKLAYPIQLLLKSNSYLIYIFQLMIGYLMITSFYKSNTKKKA